MLRNEVSDLKRVVTAQRIFCLFVCLFIFSVIAQWVLK